MKKLILLALAAVLATTAAGCSANNPQTADQPSAPTTDSRSVTLSEGVSVKGVQADVTYPLEGLDDTLAMNNLTTVKTYAGQGKVSVTPEGAESFDLFINGTAIDVNLSGRPSQSILPRWQAMKSTRFRSPTFCRKRPA